jgi:hypothetical protein
MLLSFVIKLADGDCFACTFEKFSLQVLNFHKSLQADFILGFEVFLMKYMVYGMCIYVYQGGVAPKWFKTCKFSYVHFC